MLKMIEYEMLILLKENFNDSELKSWAFNYAKTLQQLSAFDISVISRGKRDLAYNIEKQKKGNFIQLNFSGLPSFVDDFSVGLNQSRNFE